MLQQRTLRLAPASRGTASSPAREQPVGGQSTGKHTRTAKGTAAAARCVRRRSARTRRSPGGHNARNGAEPGHDELRRRSGRIGMAPSCQRKAATRMGLGTAKHEFRGSAGCLRRLSRAVVAGGTSAASVTRLGRWIRAGRHAHRPSSSARRRRPSAGAQHPYVDATELALTGHHPGPQVHIPAKRQPPGSARKKKMRRRA